MVRPNDVDRQAETETAVRRRPESGRVSIALRPVGRDIARGRRGISQTRAGQKIQSQRRDIPKEEIALSLWKRPQLI